jgi:hypothetical protein
VRTSILAFLAVAGLSAHANNGQYIDAAQHAADAAYIQTGVKSDVDRTMSHLEKLYVDKDVERYAGTIAAIFKVFSDRRLTFKWSF